MTVKSISMKWMIKTEEIKVISQGSAGIVVRLLTILGQTEDHDDENIGDMTHNLRFKSPVTRMIMRNLLKMVAATDNKKKVYKAKYQQAKAINASL